MVESSTGLETRFALLDLLVKLLQSRHIIVYISFLQNRVVLLEISYKF